MRRFVVILVILLFAFPRINVAQQPEPAEQLKKHMESCQFSQAINLAELYLSKDSTRTDLLLIKGRALAAGFQYSEATLALQKALFYDSTNIQVLNELVNVYRLSGASEMAIATSVKITGLFPDNRYFTLQLANLYYAEEDYRKAITVLLPLYLADSSSFFIARQLGICYNELKQSDSAIKFFKRALKIIPFDANVTGKLINLYIRGDETAMALYRAQVYLSHDSSSVPIMKQAGYCYYLLIDFKSSAQQLLQCYRLGDSSKFTMRYLGLSYYKQEKYDSAAPYFRKAIAADTSDAEVCFYYGVSAYRSLAVDTGLLYLNRTLRLLMPSAQFLTTLYSELADANTSNGNADTAIIFLEKALEASPENNTIRFKIAYQYDYHLKKPYDGLPYYREFLRNDIPGTKAIENLPQHILYSDYAKNRIKEITGTRKK
jgi:tetratricopeptide (TPR) repeat protein